MRGEIKWLKWFDLTQMKEVSRKAYFINGVEVTEAEWDAAFPVPESQPGDTFMCASPGIWPLKSEALAVHPSQIAEARESALKRGVPTDFTPSGRVIFRDRAHRRAYMKAYGYHDKDGGYGDAQQAPPRKRIQAKPGEVPK